MDEYARLLQTELTRYWTRAKNDVTAFVTKLSKVRADSQAYPAQGIVGAHQRIFCHSHPTWKRRQDPVDAARKHPYSAAGTAVAAAALLALFSWALSAVGKPKHRRSPEAHKDGKPRAAPDASPPAADGDADAAAAGPSASPAASS